MNSRRSTRGLAQPRDIESCSSKCFEQKHARELEPECQRSERAPLTPNTFDRASKYPLINRRSA